MFRKNFNKNKDQSPCVIIEPIQASLPQKMLRTS